MKPEKVKSPVQKLHLERMFDALLDGYITESQLEEITQAILRLVEEMRSKAEGSIDEQRLALEEFAGQLTALAEQNLADSQSKERTIAETKQEIKNLADQIFSLETKLEDTSALEEMASNLLETIEARAKELQELIPKVKEKTTEEIKTLLDKELDGIRVLDERVKEMNTDMHKLSNELVNITPRIEIFDAGTKVGTSHKLNFAGGSVTLTNGIPTYTPTSGAGDMLKATYDTDNDGVVDEAAAIEGVGSAGNSKYYGTNGTGTAGFYDLTATVASLNDVTDVTITSIASGEILKWNGSAWINNTLAEAGIATSAQGALADSALQNVVEDTTPQLGGQLDVNGNALGDGTLELLTFTETASAVNHVNLTNATTTNGPTVSAAGDDLNIDLNLAGKGSGVVNAGGNRVLTTADEGTGNGLDADTVDGVEASAFLQNVVEDTTPQLGGDLASNGNDVRMADANGIYFGTGNDLLIYHDGSDHQIVGNNGNFLFDNTSATAGFKFTLGTDTSATGLEIRNNSLGVLFSVDGDGTITLGTGTTGVLRADSGVVSTDSDVTDLVSAASTTLAGKSELATTAEVDTGTDTGRTITPDALAGSYAGTKSVGLQVTDGSGAITTGDGKAYFRVPTSLNGMNLVSVAASLTAPSTSGTPTIQIARGRQAAAGTAHSFVDMLSTAITIDANEYDSKDATTAAVINTSNDDVATGDLIRIDVDGVGSGPTAVLSVNLEFRLP